MIQPTDQEKCRKDSIHLTDFLTAQEWSLYFLLFNQIDYSASLAYREEIFQILAVFKKLSFLKIAFLKNVFGKHLKNAIKVADFLKTFLFLHNKK